MKKFTQQTKNPLMGNNPVENVMRNTPGRKISKKGLFSSKRKGGKK